VTDYTPVCRGARVGYLEQQEARPVMTIERKPQQSEHDPEATVVMPQPVPLITDVSSDLEDVDPEQTLVREDWESTVIRRVAPHVAAIQDVTDDTDEEERFGWETGVLRRLSRELGRQDNGG
jgi:hypothetical protein